MKAIQTRAVSAHGDDPESLFSGLLILRITFHPVAFHQIFLHPLACYTPKMKEILGNDKDRDVLKIPIEEDRKKSYLYFLAWPNGVKSGYEGSSPSTFFLLSKGQSFMLEAKEKTKRGLPACLKEAFTIIILRSRFDLAFSMLSQSFSDPSRVNGDPGNLAREQVQSLKFSILSPNLSSSSSSRSEGVMGNLSLYSDSFTAYFF
ncbi:hypothetical protein ACJX0J_004897 (mitochondrion) [Zea mays]